MADDLKALNDALDVAIDTGDVSALRKALASGADISRWGRAAAESAVTYALISNCSEEILEILRKAGLDMWGRSAEKEDAKEPFPRVDRLLSQALFSSVATPKVVSYLLAQGADPNRRVYGRPLLGAFFCRGADVDLAVLDVLLAARPDVDAPDAEGATALMHAASRDGAGRAEALERLLARGADLSRRDRHGKSAADRAAAVPAPAYLDVFRRHAIKTGTVDSPSAITMHFPAQDLRAGSFFVLEPIGTPLSLRWSASADSAEAAMSLIERRYGTSRPPIGPFPLLQMVSAGNIGRTADPFAVRHAGKAAPGNLLVLSLTAFSPEDPWVHDGSPVDPRPIFVVSGVFAADALQAAQSLANTQTGWSLIARLRSLTMMTDGCPDPVAQVQTN